MHCIYSYLKSEHTKNQTTSSCGQADLITLCKCLYSYICLAKYLLQNQSSVLTQHAWSEVWRSCGEVVNTSASSNKTCYVRLCSYFTCEKICGLLIFGLPTGRGGASIFGKQFEDELNPELKFTGNNSRKILIDYMVAWIEGSSTLYKKKMQYYVCWYQDSNQRGTAFIRLLRCLSSDLFGRKDALNTLLQLAANSTVVCTFCACARCSKPAGGASLVPVLQNMKTGNDGT